MTDLGWPAFFVDRLEAAVPDTDGVLTDTASVHAVAWKRLFDEYLQLRAVRDSPPFQPFTEVDYLAHVDGRPCDDGVAGFLASRGASSCPGVTWPIRRTATVCGLGNAKDPRSSSSPTCATTALRPFHLGRVRAPTAGARAADGGGLGQPHMVAVLEAAGLRDLFEVEVDGVEADRLGLAAQARPGAVRAPPGGSGWRRRGAAAVEDALAGVEAGRRGRFAA